MAAHRNGLLLLFLSLSLLDALNGANSSQLPNNLVSGTVTFLGAPLAGVTVTAFNTNTNAIAQVAVTDVEGNYTLQLPAWINTTGTASADYHIWAIKPGYGFHPSVGPGANVTRADHTGDFVGNGLTDTAIYFTVIHYIALPNLANRSLPGPPLAGANFTAYDGSNPIAGVASDSPSSQVELGRQNRFTDNQNGTVTDRLTGLIWLQNAGCINPASWFSALAAVNALANGACGLSDGSAPGDWRLPNLNELESLIDISVSNPAVAPGNPFTNLSGGLYWTSTSYFGGQGGSPSAWVIRLADGRYINDWVSNSKSASYNGVWAVKDGSSGAVALPSTGMYVVFAAGDDGSLQKGVPLTFPRWVDKGDGTVADTVTGLVWLKQADCIDQTWDGAKAALALLSSGQCGLTDGSQAGSWRMPTRNEMQSLSDRMENNHADFFSKTFFYRDGTLFQSAIFSNFMISQFYWTSTPDAADPTEVWTVYSCDFGVYDAEKANQGYTLAVRSAQPSATPDPERERNLTAPLHRR